MLNTLKQKQFLFEELVKRDFIRKYKRAILGTVWSLLSPLLNLLMMSIVFTHFFGKSTPHYMIYLFTGQLVFSYYREATCYGMTSLALNAPIFSHINMPKYMFLLSQNISAMINFGLTMVVFLLFVIGAGIQLQPRFLLLIYPAVCLLLFNVGIGLILSALYLMFKDIQYMYDFFTMMLMYSSAIFYTINSFPPTVQTLFLLNPLYVYIYYIRQLVIGGTIPSLWYHGLCMFYALLMLGIGSLIYKKYNHQFLYYI